MNARAQEMFESACKFLDVKASDRREKSDVEIALMLLMKLPFRCQYKVMLVPSCCHALGGGQLVLRHDRSSHPDDQFEIEWESIEEFPEVVSRAVVFVQTAGSKAVK